MLEEPETKWRRNQGEKTLNYNSRMSWFSCATLTAIFRASSIVQHKKQSCKLMLRIARCWFYSFSYFFNHFSWAHKRLLWISFCGTLIGQHGAAIIINNKNLFSELILNDRAFEISRFESLVRKFLSETFKHAWHDSMERHKKL